MRLHIKRRDFLNGLIAILAFPTGAVASPKNLIVNRTESCGCCGAWVEQMVAQGFKPVVNFVTDKTLQSIKTDLGIAAELSSCHTATIDNYFIEGHVPAKDIQRLIRERPKAMGLSVPGMPIGSPGMEIGDKKEPFETLLIFENGKTQVFNRHA
jgi:hypothetical protein